MDANSIGSEFLSFQIRDAQCDVFSSSTEKKSLYFGSFYKTKENSFDYRTSGYHQSRRAKGFKKLKHGSLGKTKLKLVAAAKSIAQFSMQACPHWMTYWSVHMICH